MRDDGVRVIFKQENLDTAETDSDLMISIIESFAQAENKSRSDSIRWGIKQRVANGTSKLYDRKCYGLEMYITDNDKFEFYYGFKGEFGGPYVTIEKRKNNKWFYTSIISF